MNGTVVRHRIRVYQLSNRIESNHARLYKSESEGALSIRLGGDHQRGVAMGLGLKVAGMSAVAAVRRYVSCISSLAFQ